MTHLSLTWMTVAGGVLCLGGVVALIILCTGRPHPPTTPVALALAIVFAGAALLVIDEIRNIKAKP